MRTEERVEVVVNELVSGLFARGWTPVDLVEIVRRRADPAGVSYVLDSIAATTRQYAAATLHPRWQAQLRQLGAEVWWRSELSHLQQWAHRRQLAHSAALEAVVRTATVLNALPALQVVLPPPGSSGWDTRAAEPVDERMLAKVRALLAKAEATEFEAEADTLSAKAQELMTRYCLHRAVADQSRGIGQVAGARRMWLDAPYVSGKASLVNAVADANRCRCVSTEQLGFVTVVGDEVDQHVVELLSTSLLVQATRAMTAAGPQINRYGTSRTRSFRSAFLYAYAGRIGERLRESTAQTVDLAAAGGPEAESVLPVLAARTRAVEERVAELFPNLVASRVSVSNRDGWRAGRAAADLARLDTQHPIHGSATERAS